MASIQLQAIEKWFDDTQVIKGIDFDISDGEFIVLVGPSGCGKSTMLRILAGLEDATAGSIRIDGEDLTGKLPSERGLSMVFQSYALYPHMNVAANIGFALKTAGVSKSEIEHRVAEVARTLRLEPLLDRLPKQLSGGLLYSSLGLPACMITPSSRTTIRSASVMASIWSWVT